MSERGAGLTSNVGDNGNYTAASYSGRESTMDLKEGSLNILRGLEVKKYT